MILRVRPKVKYNTKLQGRSRIRRTHNYTWHRTQKQLRADVGNYQPEVGKTKFLKKPPKNYVDSPRYSSNENINFNFIG